MARAVEERYRQAQKEREIKEKESLAVIPFLKTRNRMPVPLRFLEDGHWHILYEQLTIRTVP